MSSSGDTVAAITGSLEDLGPSGLHVLDKRGKLLWKTEAGKLDRWGGPRVAVSPSGERVALRICAEPDDESSDRYLIFDRAGLQLLDRLVEGDPEIIGFTPDDRQLLFRDDEGGLVQLDLATRRCRRRPPSGRAPSTFGLPGGRAIRLQSEKPDAGGTEEHAITVKLQVGTHSSGMRSLEFSGKVTVDLLDRSGRAVASEVLSLRWWDAAAVSVSSDGELILIAPTNRDMIALSKSGQVLWEAPLPTSPEWLLISAPPERVIVMASGDGVYCLDETGQGVRESREGANAIAMDQMGELLVAVGGADVLGYKPLII